VLLWLLGTGTLAQPAAARASDPDPRPTERERAPTVVLISLDGTRPADVSPERLPSLVALGRAGARAEGLVPIDPPNTFPSHVSLATGVRPDVHRLVNNSFIDPERGRFTRDAPHRWIESEPIWSIAERHGMRTAAYFWVGSEGPWQGGPGPSDTRRFSSRTSEKTKVNRILSWLAIEDPAERPRLILSWFHGADHAAHDSGPDSPAVTRLLAPQDREIARLVREMEARGLFASTTLIFVSDHGMVRAQERLDLAAALRAAGLRPSVLGIGGFASIVFKPSIRTEEALARAVEVARAEGLEAWRREQAPADWHMTDPRFGDVVVRAPIGVAIVRPSTNIEGFHGYDAREPAMAGLLVARGRGVRAGTRLGRVSALAIAPTVLSLLGLPIPPQMKLPAIPELLVGLSGADPGRESTADSGETR
jgi:predicted AlkP superfamily pyrophosphatase or phosphodiesterase